jgi:hypothetical protein
MFPPACTCCPGVLAVFEFTSICPEAEDTNVTDEGMTIKIINTAIEKVCLFDIFLCLRTNLVSASFYLFISNWQLNAGLHLEFAFNPDIRIKHFKQQNGFFSGTTRR